VRVNGTVRPSAKPRVKLERSVEREGSMLSRVRDKEAGEVGRGW